MSSCRLNSKMSLSIIADLALPLISKEYHLNMQILLEKTLGETAMKPSETTSNDLKRRENFAPSSSDSPLQRFEESMKIDYEKWHDGVGYDLEAIKSASPEQRKAIEQILTQHSPRDWRDIEALVQIDTISARESIKNSMKDSNIEVQIAVTRFATKLITDNERSQVLIRALRTAEIFSGLLQTLDEIEDYHPKEIKEALIEELLNREGEVAVLFAGMLFYIYGKATEAFDWNQRPFFLRFNTENKVERVQAFLELCKELDINSEKYLGAKQ
jgi:hypothetical protein